MTDETNNPQDPGQTPEPPPSEVSSAPETTAAPPPETPPPPPPAPGADVPEPVGATAEVPKARKKRTGLLVGLLVGVILVAAGASAAVMMALRGTSDVLLSKAPDSSLIYATVYLDPAAAQKMNIESLLGKFPDVGNTSFDQQFNTFMNGAFSGTGLDYETDVKPWLGTQMGAVVVPSTSEPGVAALLASKNDSAAEAALAEMKTDDRFGSLKWTDQDYKGVAIASAGYDMSDMGVDMGAMTPAMVYGIVDGAVVLSNNVDVVKAIVDASKGDVKSLADSSSYSDTMGQLPKERVADVFVNGAALTDLVKQTADLSGMVSVEAGALRSLEALRGAGMSLSVESDGVAMKMAGLVDTSKLPAGSTGAAPRENAVVSWTPADAYGFLASGNLGQSLGGLIDQIDQASPGLADQVDQMGLGKVIDALSGDFGVVVTPSSGRSPAGAVLMATDDEAAMQTFLDVIAPMAASAFTGSSGGDAGDGSLMPPGLPMTPSTDAITPLSVVTAPQWQTEDYEGATISYLRLPDAMAEDPEPAYAVTDGMAIIATSPDEIKKLIDAHGGSQITSSPNYEAAISHADAQNSGMFYLDIEAILQAVSVDDGGETANSLKPLKAMVVTGGGSSEEPTATVFILIT
jgi:hypothetical protein